ncbi:FGGY family carbohydrate kinase [bacterium]|nr:FGGY family carbohydrate kinase [Akkermansiaceae bacterium]MDA7935704.1 FGGY family carbohydrate kinase [Akkermansiaceae bacterium]MDB4407108.1 FGGY family carbohydrate kinase [bacterium]MDB4568409.1 FGGY family carbohydrate kinase [Akkermansiaceae bacterium]
MYFLGIESSARATKAIVVDLESASVIASATAPHSLIDGLPEGHLEQDPAEWIEALDKTVKDCLNQLGPRRNDVVAMAVGAQSKGFVILDEDNQIIRPSKVSGDQSALKQLDQFNREFGGPPGLSELTGNALEADGLAAQLLWLKEREPYNFQKAVSVMQSHDFLNYWLTGVRRAEVGDASRTGLLDVKTGNWHEILVDFIDPGLSNMLLPVSGEVSVLGSLRKEVFLSWGLHREILVSAGSGRAMMAALGSGSSHLGTAVIDLGLTGAVWGLSGQPHPDPRNEVSIWCDATHQWLAHFEEDSAVASLEIMQEHYAWNGQQMEAAAAAAEVGAGGLMALPLGHGTKHQGGQGMFHGVTTGNFTPGNMARASLEGVAVGLAYGFHRMRELEIDFQTVCVTGKGVGSKLWRQLLADVCGVQTYSLKNQEGAALGAAIHAAVAYFRQTGESLSFSEMAAYAVVAEDDSWCTPDEGRHKFYLDQLSKQQYLAETLIGAGFLV